MIRRSLHINKIRKNKITSYNNTDFDGMANPNDPSGFKINKTNSSETVEHPGFWIYISLFPIVH